MFDVVKRLVVGRPLASTQMEEQRLPKSIALAVFSSDALSSTAYATEEILFVVAVGGSSLALGLSKLVPIAVVVAALLAIVITSYRQVIFAYPNGGGAYVVSKENIGEMASLVAAASLMVDYILTVAVSISAGVAAIISIPSLSGLATHRVELGVVLIILITLMNMRGIKESGTVFAIPTYLYILVFGALIVYGLVRSFTGDIGPIAYDPEGRGHRPRDRWVPLHLPAVEGLLVGCSGPHRSRGDLQRCAGVPAPGGEERGCDAGLDGGAPGHALLRHLRARASSRALPE